MKKPLLLIALCIIMLAALMSGCSTENQSKDVESKESQALTVGSMKGATSIGLASLMQDQESLVSEGKAPVYDFSVAATADELVPLVAKGEFDFALVPANLAAKLYSQTNGDIKAIGINTLGVLYGIAYDSGIDSIDGLVGRTLYMTGKGSVPGFTIEYLLQNAGIVDSVNIEYKSEPSEALAALQNDKQAIAILPEPFASAALTKDPTLVRVLDITKLWDEAMSATNEGGRFVTGVTVARSEVIQNNPEAVKLFLDACEKSANDALEDSTSIADKLVEMGIIGNAKLVESVVPKCNLVCIRGEEMKADLSGYLAALASVEPASVGDELPDSDFYFTGA